MVAPCTSPLTGSTVALVVALRLLPQTATGLAAIVSNRRGTGISAPDNPLVPLGSGGE